VVASSAQARLTMPIDINAHHNLQPGLKASISGFVESAIWKEYSEKNRWVEKFGV